MDQEQQSQLPQDQSHSPFPSKQPVQKDDPKFDEIKAQLGTTITQNLNDPKWEQKKQGLDPHFKASSIGLEGQTDYWK